ncbi:F-box/LRR-repeat protein [Trifolium repens]|nr:F-box/LRR-repeat protein [Trifolium repens]
MVETDFYYLPDECWECIFMFLNDDDRDRRYLKSLSLVSKRFLFLTNRVRLTLKFRHPTVGFISRYFQRFPNLTSLDLSYCFNSTTLNNLLRNISAFPLNITSLNLSNQIFPSDGLRYFSQNITTLTSLKCSNMLSISNTDLLLIADCFPLLQQLDLSNPAIFDYNTLSGIHRNTYFREAVEALSLTLSKLQRINLSAHYYMNNRLLFHLFKNCKFLKEAIIFDCYLITINGIALAICERPTLTSLSLLRSSERGCQVIVRSITPRFVKSLASLKGLTSLDLSSLNISDELLSSIAMEGLPLRKLVLRNCTGYSYDGIFRLLSKCPCIQHLDLQYTRFLEDNQHLTDQRLVQLSSFLGHLISINLNHCRKLTESALFALARSCPLLSEIKMEYTLIGKESAENSNHPMNYLVYPQLKSLRLANNYWLRDENIIMFASIFPNLQMFDWSQCDLISKGIFFQVIKRCRNIRHLNLVSNAEVNLMNLLRMNFEAPKLEVLNLSHTDVICGTLYVISKNCRGLLHLLLRCCPGVTEVGVNIVLENCTQLREIDLWGCYQVNSNVVSSMISSRPSLRKIIAPPGFDLKDIKKKRLFLYQGCFIC